MLPAAAVATHRPGHNPGPAYPGPAYPGPAPPGPGQTPSLSIAAKPATTVFQGATVISGRLQDQNKGGRTVVLVADEYPFTGGYAFATTKTDNNGSYSFTRRPARNTLFRAAVGSLRSAALVVNVRIRMSLSVSDSTPRVGQRVRFSLDPRDAFGGGARRSSGPDLACGLVSAGLAAR